MGSGRKFRAWATRLGGRHVAPMRGVAPCLRTLPCPPFLAHRLLQAYVRQGRKAGVPSHKLVAWVRRKLGSNIAVWRCTTDGALARAAPCLFCSRELLRFDIRVHCPTDASGGWFSGRLSDVGAPVPALTGGQQRVLRAQGWRLCADPVPPQTEAIQAPQQQQQRQQRGQRHTQKQQQQQQQRRRRPQ